MKQRKPLQRKTPLKQGTGGLKQGKGLKRTKGLEARSTLKAKPKAPRTTEEAAASRRWWEIVTNNGKGPCVICGSRYRIQGHHAIGQEEIKRRCRTNALDLTRWLWDTRNGIAVCESDHMAHESAHRRIPRSKLSPANVMFARQLGCEHLLERYYPDDTLPSTSDSDRVDG